MIILYFYSIAHVLKQSGCDVPEYMLTMKKRPKKERKKLESSAPPRNDITTKPIYEILKKKRQLYVLRGVFYYILYFQFLGEEQRDDLIKVLKQQSMVPGQ